MAGENEEMWLHFPWAISETEAVYLMAVYDNQVWREISSSKYVSVSAGRMLVVTGGLTEQPEHHVLNSHGQGLVLRRDCPAAETQSNTD